MARHVHLKAKQDDLRRLMKERRENLQVQKQKIESPLAKYNSVGQLYCIVCNMHIKNESLWSNHIVGKIHKENVQKKKKNIASTQQSEIIVRGEKRNAEQHLNEAKRTKGSNEENSISPDDVKPERSTSKTTKVALLQDYSSSDDDDINEDKPLNKPDSTNNLPKDFFDGPSQSANTTNSTATEQEKEKDTTSAKSADALPEGFFDDPVLDAKARNIEYKDPVEEEWEKFQKTIAEETNVSHTIMEEDVVESTAERNIEQIEQQIQHWEVVKTLQSKFEEECLKAVVKKEAEDTSDSAEEEFDDLLDWRSKGVRKQS